MIFGPKLIGKQCNVDADCVTPYNAAGTSYYCEVKGPFNTVVNPYYGFGYTKGKCIEKYEDVPHPHPLWSRLTLCFSCSISSCGASLTRTLCLLVSRALMRTRRTMSS